MRELQKVVPSVQYYYMGFYIHTCPKMRYKARISPSFLLCPETFTFQPIKACLEKITRCRVCRLHPDPEAKDENALESVNEVRVQRTLTFAHVKQSKILHRTYSAFHVFRFRFSMSNASCPITFFVSVSTPRTKTKSSNSRR